MVDVIETDCEDLFATLLDGCPACPEDGCQTLATIRGYIFDADVEDEDIDNLSDRQLLPSTSLLTEVVQCMLENGGDGEPGPQGPPGPPPDPPVSKALLELPAGSARPDRKGLPDPRDRLGLRGLPAHPPSRWTLPISAPSTGSTAG